MHGRYNFHMISALPIIAAGLVPLITGALWYHPCVFGNRWMSLKRITPEMAERSSRQSLLVTFITVLLGIVTAAMLAFVVHVLRLDTIFHAALSGFCIWISFVVPTAMHRVLWDHVPLALFFIETGQWLVSLVIMTTVLSY